MKTIPYILTGKRPGFHFIFCLVVLALLSLGIYFLHLSGFRFDSMVSAYTDCLFFLLCIYTGRWLVGRWYLRNKLPLFSGFTLLCCITLTILKFLLVKYVFGHRFAGFNEVLWGLMPFFLIGLIAGMLLKLIRASMQRELRDAHIKTEQRESEFGLLQSQLSPHFLFNVLNNLYGISLEEHQRVPALLLKLADLLRYSVYGAKKRFVPLKEELEYIRNYIAFEQIRISDRLVLETDMEQVINPDLKMAPLVLIVFIENAFKHAKNTLNQKIYVYISLKISGNFICFTIANSYQEQENINSLTTESSGLGLANTRKRLDLLYGSDYEWKQSAENDLYTTRIKLKISNE